MSTRSSQRICWLIMTGWLCCRVGNNSTADIGRDVDSLLMMTEREIDIWRSGCFEILTAIVHDGAVKFYVNAQGYNYARYAMLKLNDDLD